MDEASSQVRVPPFNYIHVLDNNTNTRRVEVGPQTFHRHDHEKIILQATKMHVIPPYCYCIIENPYIRVNEKTREPFEKDGQVLLRFGESEIRFSQDWKQPFPLLPGERMKGSIQPVEVVGVDTALRLFALRNFEEIDEETKKVTI